MERNPTLSQQMDDPHDWRWLSEILQSCPGQNSQPLEKRLGISLQWVDPKTPILQVSEKVGTIQFINSATQERFNLSIHPKVPGSVTGMLRAVLNSPEDDLFSIERLLSGTGTHPSTWLASIYLIELERFLMLLRPRGEEIEDELISRVKGRFLKDQYFKRNYWTLRHVAPCRFVEWTVDNLPNRILLYALFLSRHALSSMRINASLELGLARRCEAALSDVHLARINKNDLAGVMPLLQGPFMHYQRVIQFAKLVISILDPFAVDVREIEDMPIARAFDLDSLEDGSVKWDLVDMPKLFEQYVRTITKGKATGRRFPVPLEGNLSPELAHLVDKNMKLDREPIRSGSNGVWFVIDAKYKALEFLGQTKTPRIGQDGTYHLSEYQYFNLTKNIEIKPIEMAYKQISNADLYQVIAYATHKDIRASSVALVYPSTNNQIIGEVPHYTGLGFHSEEDQGIFVYVLTIRIDPKGIKEELAGEGLNQKIMQIFHDIQLAKDRRRKEI